jgi:hypothetical protein
MCPSLDLPGNIAAVRPPTIHVDALVSLPRSRIQPKCDPFDRGRKINTEPLEPLRGNPLERRLVYPRLYWRSEHGSITRQAKRLWKLFQAGHY